MSKLKCSECCVREDHLPAHHSNIKWRIFLHNSPSSALDLKIQECKQKAEYIIDNFLKDTSMFQINTSGKLLRKLFSAIEEKCSDETLFDDILQDIISSMLVFRFENFTDSPFFQDMIHRVQSNKVVTSN